jgi:tetratricopeptide (TPR) repeat protein
VVAAYAATRPTFRLSAVAGQLGVSSDVSAVLSWSYRALSPAAAQLFRLLGVHPGPDVSVAAAASLLGQPVASVLPLLTELSRANLVTEHVPGRYTFHDLLRGYAAEQARLLDSADERRTATHRVLDHYLYTASAATRLLDPQREPAALGPPPPEVVVPPVTGYPQALNWFETEYAVLIGAVPHAAAHGLDTHVCHLTWALDTFLWLRGHWADLAAVGEIAVASAQRLGDPHALALAHRNLAHAYLRQKRSDDANTHFQAALDLHRELGDRPGQAHTHMFMAGMRAGQGRQADALHHAEQALDLYRSTGSRAWQADALRATGWYHATLGDHQQAITLCRQALAVLQELGDRRGQAWAWHSIGETHHLAGEYAQAVTCYQHGLDLCRMLGDRDGEAEILTQLGDTQHADGDPRAAHHTWVHALAILDEMHHANADRVRTKLARLAR